MFQMFPYADVSTSLVEDKDLRMLPHETDHESEILVISSYPEGFFVALPTDVHDYHRMLKYAGDRGYSKKFIDLMKALKAYNFCYFRLDADGCTTELPSLPHTNDQRRFASTMEAIQQDSDVLSRLLTVEQEELHG